MSDVQRITPFDLVFGDPVFEAERFPAIGHEADSRAIDANSLERFTLLGETGVLMQHMIGDDAPGESVREIGQLLFHAYHFWKAGKHLVSITEPLSRALATRSEPVGSWRMLLRHPAGYLQLPRNLFWSRIREDAIPEPADGMFFHTAERADGTVSRLELLLVLGLRPERAGLSLVAIGGAVPEPPGHWADETVRADGGDFTNVLPGGDLGGLHSLVAAGELLKLASLCFWYGAMHGGWRAENDEHVAMLDVEPVT